MDQGLILSKLNRKKINSMNKFFLIQVLLMFAACKNPNKQYQTIIKDGVIIKGKAINDSIFNDTVFYYNRNNNLIQKDYFRNGRIDGESIHYFTNGKPMKIATYKDGLKNGYNSYYDSLGKCYYQDFYFYDLVVGPISYYDKQENPLRFFFVNLENKTLLDIDYRKWVGIEKVVPNVINYSYDKQRKDSTDEISLLLYLIKPPKLALDYSLLKINRQLETEIPIISKIENDLPFSNLTLPVLSDSFYYSIRVSIYDSILKKQTIIKKEVW